MTHISQLAADAGLQGRTSPSVPAIHHDDEGIGDLTLGEALAMLAVAAVCAFLASLREGGSTPARPLVILIGAACSWLAVFCVAYFAAELLRGLVR